MNTQEIPRRARRLAFAAAVGAAVVGSFALASSAQGQDQQRMDPRQMIDQRMERLTATLKLDSAQQGRVRSILSDEVMAMEDLRKNGGGHGGMGGGRSGGGGGGGGGRGGGMGGRGGGRRGGGGGDGGAPPDTTGGESRGPSTEVRAIRDRTNKQIEKLLNPDQLTTYRQLFEQPQQRPPADTTSHRGNGSS